MAPSHVTPLPEPSDGLLSRLFLIEQARHRIDAQYYLWDSDAVGSLLLEGLIGSADRGVAVRLLVDDLKLRSRSRSIAALCLHPNIEIRVFNRFRWRGDVVGQGLEFLFRFQKLDHRMHNKLIICDGVRAVVGGRNVADEHYGLATTCNLVDFDVLLEGPTVTALTEVFERYWASPAASPGSSLSRSVTHADLRAARRHVAEELAKRRTVLSGVLGEQAAWTGRVERTRRPLRDGAVAVASDAPAVTGGAEPDQVIAALHDAVDRARGDIIIVTPFFVPGENDVDWYRTLTGRGLRLRLLTNSLASNPGTVSNSGLDEERAAVVEAGVELYELCPDAATKPMWDTHPRVSRYLGLHAKLYVVDRETLIVGSVNLDPRSKFVNTEIAVSIEDSGLATDAARAIAVLMRPENAWRVEIALDGRLRWRRGNRARYRQPSRSAAQRIADRIFSLLPIDDYI